MNRNKKGKGFYSKKMDEKIIMKNNLHKKKKRIKRDKIWEYE